jgi:hypothetical protein
VATLGDGDQVTVVIEVNGAALHGAAANRTPVALNDKRANGRALAVARAIAQKQGGDLVVDCEERERGTRITLRLPVPARASAHSA